MPAEGWVGGDPGSGGGCPSICGRPKPPAAPHPAAPSQGPSAASGRPPLALEPSRASAAPPSSGRGGRAAAAAASGELPAAQPPPSLLPVTRGGRLNCSTEPPPLPERWVSSGRPAPPKLPVEARRVSCGSQAASPCCSGQLSPALIPAAGASAAAADVDAADADADDADAAADADDAAAGNDDADALTAACAAAAPAAAGSVSAAAAPPPGCCIPSSCCNAASGGCMASSCSLRRAP